MPIFTTSSNAQRPKDDYLDVMHKRVEIVRPERRIPTLRRMARALPQPTARSNIVTKREKAPLDSAPNAPIASFKIDPYLDYGRFLTAEGGILIMYKDHDLRWRHTTWRLLAWLTFTGLETDYISNIASLQNLWIKIILLLAAAIANWFIVAMPIELYRKVEIRPDCMIIDGGDVFWARFIEGGFPSCRPDAGGNQIFSGTYGTRFVEYLTIRRFDENDRMPEVMSAHLQEAMRQLWMMPY